MGQLVFQATLGGQVNLVGPNTASTFNLNVPAVSSTLATLTGTETFTNKTLTSPTLTTPVLGTPSSGTLTNCTGLPNAGLVNSSVTVGSTAISLGGTATTVAGLTSLATNTLTSASATNLTLQSAGTTAVTIDTSQNVGIGTTSPTAKLDVRGGVFVIPSAGWSSGNTATINLGDSGNGWSCPYGLINTLSAYNGLAFSTSNSERMRIDSSGNLLVGGTSVRDGAKVSIDTSTNGMSIYVIPNTSAVDFAIFRANSGTLCGAISRVGTTGAVVYTATSDYRLKENIAPISGALDKVSTLNPVTFTWKDGGGNADGFIAHEFAEVCPNGVIGEKNGVDENGNPKYQAIDSSAAIPFLTAAIQELKAINDTQAETINALTARIVALESK